MESAVWMEPALGDCNAARAGQEQSRNTSILTKLPPRRGERAETMKDGEAPRTVSLRQWIGDREDGACADDTSTLLGKIAAAYGITELLRHLRSSEGMAAVTRSQWREMCSVDNFSVRLSKEEGEKSRVEGVDLLAPPVSLDIVEEPSFLSDCSLGDPLGSYLEAEVSGESPSTPRAKGAGGGNYWDESMVLHALGLLLRELFSCVVSEAKDDKENYCGDDADAEGDSKITEPSRSLKKRFLSPETNDAGTAAGGRPRPFRLAPLQEFRIPPPVSLLLENLLECGSDADKRTAEAYDSLETCASDLHLLLLEPSRFLFDAQKRGPLTPEDAGKMRLKFRTEKLYGREPEVSLIQEAFCRVSSGQSEAFFIGGYSGSGKSHLVESLRPQVDVAGGYVVTRKFDQVSRPLLDVVSVFNDLCIQIKEKEYQDPDVTAGMLMAAFGSDLLPLLGRLLPNIRLIVPELNDPSQFDYSGGDYMNLQSITFVLQRFMRVVSSKTHPVMLFLDDLQWCDASALAVIEAIFSDKGNSCLFFVGSYRNNEVQAGHALHRFMDNLNKCIPNISTMLSLHGIDCDALNTMLSDAMCMFPRTCRPLSEAVFSKTKGNPFFVLEVIKTLVDRGLVQYSLRQNRWVWDEDAINSMDVTDNVLHLLNNKMSQLPERVQSVLRVVSTFGTTIIHESIIKYLGLIPEYSSIREGLEELVWESFMVKVAEGYKFVHDKIREAAFSLIPAEERDKYHESLGQKLYCVSSGQKLADEAVLPMVDHINRSLHSVQDSERINVAKLNFEAGKKCLEQSDFSAASDYLDRALALMPTDHWKSSYNFSLELYFLLAKSAQSSGDGEKACNAIRWILKEGRCIEDKLDAYFLLATIYQAREKVEDAYMTCLEVLEKLGESVSDYCDEKDIMTSVDSKMKAIASKSQEELITVKETVPSQLSSVMRFYHVISIVAFFVKPQATPLLCCRMLELTLTKGVTEWSAMSYLQFASIVIQGNLTEDIEAACKIGKLAISLVDRLESAKSASMLAKTAHLYYGLVANYTIPVQSCYEGLKRGFEAGMSNGDTFSAFFCAKDHIRLRLVGGAPLSSLEKETEYYLTVARKHGNNLLRNYFLIFLETIGTLIDKGASLKKQHDGEELNESLCIKRLSETIYTHKAFQSFWLGYAERCDHYVQKLMEMKNFVRHHRMIVTFYHALNYFRISRKNRASKVRNMTKDAIETMKKSARDSRWNYGNKVHLLEAELFSFERKYKEAQTSYAAAILSSRSSKFVHEQGLACELAGFHYKKIGDARRSWGFFNQAKMCYAQWGSQMKVDFISHQLNNLANNKK